MLKGTFQEEGRIHLFQGRSKSQWFDIKVSESKLVLDICDTRVCFLEFTRHSATTVVTVKILIYITTTYTPFVFCDGCGIRGLLWACPLPDSIEHRCNSICQVIIPKIFSGIFLVVADTALFVINIGNTWSA